MSRRPTIPPFRHDIECEVDGQMYRGTWEVDGGMVTVRTIHGTKSAVPSSSPAVIAEMLLMELVRASRGRGWS